MIKIKIWGIINSFTSNSVEDAISSLKDDNEHILVLINSKGGTLNDSIVIYNLLKSVPNPITTLAIGNCESAAAIIFSAGKSRYIADDTNFMIHQPYVVFPEIDLNQYKTKELQKRFKKSTNKYLKHLIENYKLPQSKIDIVQKEGEDLYLTPNQCIRYNIATNIFTTWNDMYEREGIDINNEEVIIFSSNETALQ